MIANRRTRRLLGTTLLLIAVVQITLGLTLLRERLSPAGTLFFWTFCFVATLGAILCALLDALANLRESRRERRDLLETTLREVDEARGAHDQKK